MPEHILDAFKLSVLAGHSYHVGPVHEAKRRELVPVKTTSNNDTASKKPRGSLGGDGTAHSSTVTP